MPDNKACQTFHKESSRVGKRKQELELRLKKEQLESKNKELGLKVKQLESQNR